MHALARPLGLLALTSTLFLSCSDPSDAVGPLDLITAESAVIVIQPPTAQSGLPFGPEMYAKPKGSPQIFETEVEIPSGFEAPFRLVVENGAQDGDDRVSSAWIDLDDDPIFTPDDFSQQVARVEREVTVNGPMTLHVQLADEPDSFLRIWVQDSGTGSVGEGGGDVVLEGGDVVVEVPAGAVEGDQEITVEVVSPPEGEEPVALVYDFGPPGTTFDEPIEIVIAVDPATLPDLPSGNPVDPTLLRLFTQLPDGTWELTLDSFYDPVTQTVVGSTTHFSQFGLLTLTRVCSGEFADVQSAYDETIPGGTIEICDGNHAVEGVVLDAPVTIKNAAGASPVIETSTAFAAFYVDGYTSGTVLFDGLTFNFNTPLETGNNSYAIRGQNTYDQIRVQNSFFNLAPDARGAIYTTASTEPTAATFVDNVQFDGGQVGVAVQNNHGEITNIQVTNLTSVLGTSAFGVRILGATRPGSGFVDGSSFDGCGYRCIQIQSIGVDADVTNNTFSDCGRSRCIQYGGGAAGEVRSNTFTAPVLTGDDDVDADQLVGFYSGATGLIDDNVFEGCGFWNCVDVFNGADVTISNNDFTHVAGQTEFEFASVISAFNGGIVTVEQNHIHSCAVFCYNVGLGSTATIRNETVDVPAGHGTVTVLTATIFDDPSAAMNLITFEDNLVTGPGPGGEVAVTLWDSDVTMNRNTFTQFADGMAINTGITHVTTVTGQDNSFSLTGTALSVQDGTTVDLTFNDFTGQSTDLSSDNLTSVLTCNFWGNVGGPQTVSGAAPASVYTPWALASIANTGASSCQGGSVRVAAADDGSGLPFFPTVADAVGAVVTGGTVFVSDGTHSVEGVTIGRPMTIQPDPGASPVIETSTAFAAFYVDGYTSGTVLFDGLTFNFNTPLETGNNSYAIRGQNTYDQIRVQNSFFNLAPDARGAIYTTASTEPTAATFVDNVQFDGGQVGVAVQNNHGEITNIQVTNLTSVLGTSAFGVRILGATRPGSGFVDGSSFDGCGYRCIQIQSIGVDADVTNNTFSDCGRSRCIQYGGGAAGEVRSNTFTAPVLTGDDDVDADQLVGFYSGATGLIDDNVFEGCGFWNCVDVFNGADVTISNNDFTHVAGQTEFEFASVISAFNGGIVTVEQNHIHSCAVFCYNVGLGSTATIRNETVDVPAGHGTVTVLTASIFDDPSAAMNLITFEDNVVTGPGPGGEVAVTLWDSDVTMNRNTFTQFADGMAINTGITHVTTVTGQDNSFSLTGTALSVQDGTTVDLTFNDFTGQSTDLSSDNLTSVLTCNFWGNVGGPQTVSGAAPASVYTPWALASIANTGASSCQGGSVRVAAADDGSGLPFFPTVAAAVGAVATGATVFVSDGTHSVEGVTIGRPMTIQPDAGASPVIETGTAFAAFYVDGYTSGTVLFDGLTFNFNTPLETGNNSYAIRGQNTYDQLRVQNSFFNLAPDARGAIYTTASTEPTAATFVDNVQFDGGQVGVAVQNNHGEITNIQVTNLTSVLGTSAFGVRILGATLPGSGFVDGSSFDGCGYRCIQIQSIGVDADVTNNTFSDCGRSRCIQYGGGAAGEVRSNTFAAPVLTGDDDVDADQLVGFYSGATGLIDDNVFEGCGFWNCVDVFNGAEVTISNNDFTHVAGQTEFEFASVISTFNGGIVTVEQNHIHSCAVFCYNVGLGSTATIRNETVEVPAGHGTVTVLTASIFDDPSAAMNLITFEDNVVTGPGPGGEVALTLWDSDVTMNRNTFTQFADGMAINTGITHVTTVTGQDNSFSLTGTALSVQDGTTVDLTFNDFTGQSTDLSSDNLTSVLTCNFWGNVGGPQTVSGAAPASVYTPWALASIANTGASGCSGSQ